MIRVMLVDKHTVLRDGLQSILQSEHDIEVIGKEESGVEALEKIESKLPDVILMEIHLRDADGIDVAHKIKNRYPFCKVLILTLENHDQFFMSAIRAGVDGYLLKDISSGEVIEAIHAVVRGESMIHPSMTKKLLDFYQKPKKKKGVELTSRENEILSYMVEGLTNKGIADRLLISDKTVKIHVSNIFKKLKVKNRAQAVIFAVRHHLVPLPTFEDDEDKFNS